MLHKKTKKESRGTLRANVTTEMSKPRMARSAQKAEQNLDRARIVEPPNVTMPGTVDKIISPRPTQPEKAQITVDGADHNHRELRIENVLTDENGENVSLKKGAHVELTVASEPKK
jgi:hypothetical protein